MEADQPSLQRLFRSTLSSSRVPELDVVRALHQTVVSLRSALDSSREELRRLQESIGNFCDESYVDVVSRLALENHVLRRKILSSCEFSCDAATSPPLQSRHVQLVEEVHMNELTNPEKTIMDVSKKIATDAQNLFNEPVSQHSNVNSSNNNSPDPSSRAGQSDKFQDSSKCSKITVTKDIINTKITDRKSVV